MLRLKWERNGFGGTRKRESFMDFYTRVHKLKPTDKILTIIFECLIKVHGIKQFRYICRENRHHWILIRPPTFPGTQTLSVRMNLPIVSAIKALHTCKTELPQVFYSELASTEWEKVKVIFWPYPSISSIHISSLFGRSPRWVEKSFPMGASYCCYFLTTASASVSNHRS